MTHPGRRAETDAAELKEIRAACPHLDVTARHVRDFADMMHDLRGNDLPAWMDRVLTDDLPALHSLVNGMKRDLDAVTARPVYALELWPGRGTRDQSQVPQAHGLRPRLRT